MPSHLIVVDKMKDFRWPDPAGRVVTAEAYLAQAELPAHGRVINLCRDHAYLGTGYYVSLLAEARGERVVPEASAFAETGRRQFQDGHAEVLDRLLARVSGPAGDTGFDLDIYFGETDDPRFRELGQRAFERLRCPLLRIRIAPDLHIAAVEVLGPRDVPAERDGLFLRSLDTYTQRRRQRPRAASTRFDLAVLRDPDDPLPPSKPKTIERLAEVGRAVGVEVVPISRKDFSRLTQFDGLFIRETTSVPSHTFRFARKAERAGMPVIDDPASIVRCTNKVFLAELLHGNGVPTPNTRFVTRRSQEALDAERTFPVVVKIPDGAFSIGVEKADDPRQLREIAGRMLKRSEIILLQDFVPTAFDWRIGVLDGAPLFAARYYMCKRHWQILKHAADGSHDEGATRAVALEDVPAAVLDAALRAARLVGNGLYGVDLKETPNGVFVMEVNDNPNIDVGMEDAALGDVLYSRLLEVFLRRAETLRPRTAPARGRNRPDDETARALAANAAWRQALAASAGMRRWR